jgi:dethiobiotin synthetase
MSVVVITGTGTEIGKTIVTAAIAALAGAAGRRVAVVKPAQTGVADGDESDVDVVRRLTGIDDVHELVRYPDPLAPATAARRAGVPALTVDVMAKEIEALPDRDLVLVEGAGGMLVHLDDSGRTLADLAVAVTAPVVVVAAAGLGTLNAIALTCEAIRHRGLTCRGVVVGSWPDTPDLAAAENLRDIETYAGAPLLGALPADSGRLDRSVFLATARLSLAPELGGEWAGPETTNGRPA